jgi:formate dehydrogenase major subunit
LTVILKDPLNPLSPPEDQNFPLVATTYRVTEHYLSGAMTRYNSWLVELQPAMFVEISPELAAARGVKNLDWVVISTPRDELEALALVTDRMQPLTVEGQPAHVVGMLWSFGYQGEAVGASTNILSPMALSPDADIQGTKSFVCQLRAGRLAHPRQRQAVPLVALPKIDLPVTGTPWAAQPEGSEQYAD